MKLEFLTDDLMSHFAVLEASQPSALRTLQTVSESQIAKLWHQGKEVVSCITRTELAGLSTGSQGMQSGAAEKSFKIEMAQAAQDAPQVGTSG